MDALERDGAAVRFPPPLVFLLVVIAGIVLHRFVVPFGLDLSRGVRIGVTVALVLAGLAVGGMAIGLLRRSGQDPRPWLSTPEIVSGGVYRYTRNPIYLGMALLQAAIGVGTGNGWILTLVPVSLVIIYFVAVRHEEAYLERKFGAVYLEYKQSVRRWL